MGVACHPGMVHGQDPVMDVCFQLDRDSVCGSLAHPGRLEGSAECLCAGYIPCHDVFFGPWDTAVSRRCVERLSFGCT